MKKKMRFIWDGIIGHSKILFPIIAVAAIALTGTVAFIVASALGAGKVDEKMGEVFQAPQTIESAEGGIAIAEVPEVEMERNEDGNLYSLMATYYNALANGDVETIQRISNHVEETEAIRIKELGKYIDTYPLIEIYTKPGPVENSYVAYVYTLVTFYGHEEEIPGLTTFYVCTDESGVLYLNEGEISEEVLSYIQTVNLQDDVAELSNRVDTEYYELMRNNTDLFDYVSELEKEVTQATGEALAQIYAKESQESGASESGGAGENAEDSGAVNPDAASGAGYATATTTVNVRSSDSEQADKLGKVTEGTRVQVTQQRANGWSQVIYEGKEGYIKSEYLRMEESGGAEGGNGKSAKATTNVNLRKAPSESADKLGVVTGGESVEVLSEENGWSRVKYRNMEGYVKSEYIQIGS